MVGRQDFTEVGTMLLGAGVGAAVSRYGSNAISDAMTKKDREGGILAKDVDLWKKAHVIDIALGAVAGLTGLYAVKGSSKSARMTSTALKSAGAYLVSNGILDLVGDLTAEADERQFNGRPLRYSGPVGARTATLGAQRRMSAQRLTSQAFVPPASRGRVALF